MSERYYQFRVLGTPVTKGSTRSFIHKATGKVITMRSNAAKQDRWDARIEAAARAAGCTVRATGPCFVGLLFEFDRPKNHYRTGKNAHLLRADAPHRPIAGGRNDLDKLVRAVLDALTGVAWVDDSQVVHVSADKLFAGHEGEMARISLRLGDEETR